MGSVEETLMQERICTLARCRKGISVPLTRCPGGVRVCMRACRFVARPFPTLLLLQGTMAGFPGWTMTEGWHLFWQRGRMSVPWLASYRGRAQPGQVRDAGRRDPRRLRMAVSQRGTRPSIRYITGHRSVDLVFAMSHNFSAFPSYPVVSNEGPKHHSPRLPQRRHSVLSGYT